MDRPIIISLLSQLILTTSVWAGQDVELSQAVEPLGLVQIINPRGELDVRGWDRSEVHVEGEIDDLADNIEFLVDGRSTLLRVDFPKKHANWGDGSDLTVYVPVNCKLKIEAVSTEVDVEGVAGMMSIRTISGDVEVSGIGNKTHINTVSGDVEVTEGEGILKVTTLSGNLRVTVDATDISVDTMSGDVEIELGTFNTLMATSVNSSLQLSGVLGEDGQVSAQSVNGNIELELGSPVNATVKARTVAGGDIDNDLTDDEPIRQPSRQMILNAIAGSGSAAIQLHTVSGDIELDLAD